MKFIIKLFPEIVIKSRPVRKRLIKQLRTNIRRIVKNVDETAAIRGDWDRLELRVSDEHADAVKDLLQNTPGIDFSLAVKEYEFESQEEIEAIVVQHFADKVDGKTFCVRVKRTGKHEFTSVELERRLGGTLFREGAPKKVQLKDPECEIKLEIIANRLFVVQDKIMGLGGYPLGFQEAALSLISGGYDSGVATYLMNKRGVRTHYCFFNLGGDAHEVGVKQVAHYLWSKFSSSHGARFVSVPFEPVVEEILTKVGRAYMGVVLKRMMLRAASTIAATHNIPAIVTGEAIAQVASQTMVNLSVVDEVTNRLVLRPLITMDKQEIIALSRAIGTEPFAKNMPEYCGVISDKPSTAAKLASVEREEARFDFSVLDRAVEAAVMTPIDEVLDTKQNVLALETTATPQIDDVIIDIRQPHELETQPLVLTNNRVIALPFYQLARKFSELDQSDTYLLYCGQGVMSQMQAQRLQEMGYKNVKVYQP